MATPIQLERHDRPEAPLDYALSLRGLSWGNDARLLFGGAEAFPPMLEAMAAAEREVLLESYMLADDPTGRAFLAAATEAARRGCRVAVIVDGIGSLMLPRGRLDQVERAGGRTLVYRPVAPWRSRWGLWKRDHRKLLVVDGTVGFIGGLNLADNYDSRRDKPPWHDLHLRLQGPSVAALRRAFAYTWNQESERPRRMPDAGRTDAAEEGPTAGGLAVQIVANLAFGHRSYLRRAFLYAVKRARRTVYIENPYFIPDLPVSRALRRAARRGIDVRVVIPRRSDVLLCDLASRAALPRLLRDGVKVAEWQDGMMHAKAATVDGLWATVGSCNLDHRSLAHNLEVTANILEPAIAGPLEEHLRADFNASLEIQPSSFAGRGLLLRLAQAVAYRLRPLL